jgi:hypothetical protein
MTILPRSPNAPIGIASPEARTGLRGGRLPEDTERCEPRHVSESTSAWFWRRRDPGQRNGRARRAGPDGPRVNVRPFAPRLTARACAHTLRPVPSAPTRGFCNAPPCTMRRNGRMSGLPSALPTPRTHGKGACLAGEGAKAAVARIARGHAVANRRQAAPDGAKHPRQPEQTAQSALDTANIPVTPHGRGRQAEMPRRSPRSARRMAHTSTP